MDIWGIIHHFWPMRMCPLFQYFHVTMSVVWNAKSEVGGNKNLSAICVPNIPKSIKKWGVKGRTPQTTQFAQLSQKTDSWWSSLMVMLPWLIFWLMNIRPIFHNFLADGVLSHHSTCFGWWLVCEKQNRKLEATKISRQYVLQTYPNQSKNAASKGGPHRGGSLRNCRKKRIVDNLRSLCTIIQHFLADGYSPHHSPVSGWWHFVQSFNTFWLIAICPIIQHFRADAWLSFHSTFFGWWRFVPSFNTFLLFVVDFWRPPKNNKINKICGEKKQLQRNAKTWKIKAPAALAESKTNKN